MLACVQPSVPTFVRPQLLCFPHQRFSLFLWNLSIVQLWNLALISVHKLRLVVSFWFLIWVLHSVPGIFLLSLWSAMISFLCLWKSCPCNWVLPAFSLVCVIFHITQSLHLFYCLDMCSRLFHSSQYPLLLSVGGFTGCPDDVILGHVICQGQWSEGESDRGLFWTEAPRAATLFVFPSAMRDGGCSLKPGSWNKDAMGQSCSQPTINNLRKTVWEENHFLLI